MPHHYCPICGATQMLLQGTCYVRQCVSCQQTVTLKDSLYESSYYQNKSIELYGDITHWHEILIDEEVSKNPQFKKELVGNKMSKEQHDKILHDIMQTKIQRDTNNNKPKCPTCQSTNIKKISVTKKVTHGLMFGILSKTAFSQFECCNCGYKW